MSMSSEVRAEEAWERGLAQLHNQIDERLTTMLCIGKAKTTMETYEKAIAAVSSGDGLSQEKNITQRFRELVAQRTAIWKKFDTMLEKWAALAPKDAESFAKDMMNLRKETGEIRALLDEQARAEMEFATQLAATKTQLEGLAIFLDLRGQEFALNDCGVINVGPNISDAKRSVESWIAILDAMNGHIISARNEIFSLVDVTHQAIEKSYEQKITDLLDHGFLEIWHKVRRLSALENLLDEKFAFEQDVATNGYDDHLYSKFLQYRASIAAMAHKLERGEEIQANIRRFASVTDVRRYDNEMNFTLANIKKRMQEVESAGWQGCLERQIMLNNKRKERIHLLPASCSNALEAHLESARSVDSAETYSSIESKYVNVIRECNR